MLKTTFTVWIHKKRKVMETVRSAVMREIGEEEKKLNQKSCAKCKRTPPRMAVDTLEGKYLMRM